MQDLEKDIEAALTLLEKGYISATDFINYSGVFLKTNEDLGEYYKYFTIQDGIVSTIIGSGDHVLQAIKDKPKEIHAFDKNIFAIYMAKLKIATCLSLDLKKFEEYFEYCGKNFFSEDYYKIVREYLDDDTRTFWDEVYTKGNIRKRYNSFFIATMGNSNIGPNSFEKEKNYEKTRENIDSVIIKYYPLEFFDMFKNMNNEIKFDAIFLSNIYNWLNSYDKEQEFLQFTKQELTKHLTENGMIAVYTPPKYFSNKKIVLTDDLYSVEKNKILVYIKK